METPESVAAASAVTPGSPADQLAKKEAEKKLQADLKKVRVRFVKIEQEIKKSRGTPQFVVCDLEGDPLVLTIARERGYGVIAGLPGQEFEIHATMPPGAVLVPDPNSKPAVKKRDLVGASAVPPLVEGKQIEYACFIQPVSRAYKSPTDPVRSLTRGIQKDGRGDFKGGNLGMALRGGVLSAVLHYADGREPLEIEVPITNVAFMHAAPTSLLREQAEKREEERLRAEAGAK